jgi:hypothetical protein
MEIRAHFPVVDAVMERFGSALGRDRTGYFHHVVRVLNFYRALSPGNDCPDPVVVAGAFHDLGIWTAGTFDYLGPSVKEVSACLESEGHAAWLPEVRAIIEQHHKLTPYRGPFEDTVETFRRADLVDVSLGLVRSGLPSPWVREVRRSFPNAGFHRRLLALTGRQFLRDPLHPLPMMRW